MGKLIEYASGTTGIRVMFVLQRTFEFRQKDDKMMKEDVSVDMKDNYVQYHVKDNDSEVWVIEDFDRVSVAKIALLFCILVRLVSQNPAQPRETHPDWPKMRTVAAWLRGLGRAVGAFYSAPQCWHCKRCTSYSNSIRLSVRLSHAGIVSKRLHV